MKNLTWQNPEQLFVAQELINKVKSKCCGIKDKINEHKLSIVDALCELTSKEVEVKNFNAAHAMVKVAAFPHLKELKDFDFEFQPKINKQQFLDFESLRFLDNNSNSSFGFRFYAV